MATRAPNSSTKKRGRNKSPAASAPVGSKKALVVVESPAKAKTLRKYLGSQYIVKASVGHIRDLPRNSLSVDLENRFEPTYETIKGKASVIKDIRAAARSVNQILLAPDPDREGEAIAWHLAQELGPRLKNRVHRITFNEITKKAVFAAIENPQPIHQTRFESQQARRILDRIVGYQLSPLLWTKVRRGLSAGRVQSVVVRILVDREKEIRAFVPDEYWTIEAILQGAQGSAFVAKVIEDPKKQKFRPENEEQAMAAFHDLESAEYKIDSIDKKKRKRKAPPPFITSRLQQAAAKKLHFTAKRTMTLAQQLYEGVELGREGSVGLITYMRTDSARIADDALNSVRTHIQSTYGDAYLPKSPNRFSTKKNAQDAHEAIRPTSMTHTPDRVKPYLNHDQFRLYSLIWRQFVACQMTPAIYDQTTVDILASGYRLRATGSVLNFNGYLAAHGVEAGKESALSEVEGVKVVKEGALPPLDDGEILKCHKAFPKQHFTKPPPRFTESSLVKELEELGIGRPSTYAAILSTIVSRGYAKKEEGTFFPTDLGELITELLITSFPRIMDVRFTAKMETDLDDVESGRVDWVELLTQFYHGGFKGDLEVAKTSMRSVRSDPIESSEHTCVKCQAPMVKRMGRNGAFFACRQYPECTFTMDVETPSPQTKTPTAKECEHPCSLCGGKMMLKRGRFGAFYACLDYPQCKGSRPVGSGVDCPECDDGELCPRKSKRGKTFFGCHNYPECTFATWDKPLESKCPTCNYAFTALVKPKRGKPTVQCPSKPCSYEREPTKEELRGS